MNRLDCVEGEGSWFVEGLDFNHCRRPSSAGDGIRRSVT